ncbi:cytochrome c family protein [Marivita sp. XM-24bin2]|mgnify:CR=1 FL=1|jgi:cytochrome c|uniref:c-type cytochrome n=1 Tax=unclassified Marivita TaxID=2632480 RepID=UPI000D78F9E0|nr:cytochrome c family protein [Marivita sp. XM-24bin2]MCR9107724.1 cytochrome c family protein [Paracoccaceae bacterium]PWL34798.1 MAG: cytochrome c family protein [Marivita sp. XM-24bin2]
MFDTMTFTKIVGSFCGALLIFLLGKWAAETLYHVGGAHGEEVAVYVIETNEEEATEEEVSEVNFDTMIETADADKGERVFGKCRACHKLEAGENAAGPYLYNVVGREVGSVEDFNYSGALSEVADVWTPENLYNFLENPRGWAPGTSMGFAGLNKSEDRQNLIAYLATFSE